MAVMLSALLAGRPLPPRRFLVHISGRGLVNSRAQSAARRIRPIEKSSDFIGNRTRGLPPCSIVSKPSTCMSTVQAGWLTWSRSPGEYIRKSEQQYSDQKIHSSQQLYTWWWPVRPKHVETIKRKRRENINWLCTQMAKKRSAKSNLRSTTRYFAWSSLC
jgi:hypothetical protein